MLEKSHGRAPVKGPMLPKGRQVGVMQGLAQYASNGSMGDNARAVSWLCSCIAGLPLLKALSRDVGDE